MDKMVVLGGGGHAKVIIDIIRKQKLYSIIGYVDPRDRGEILGVAYLGPESKVPEFIRSNPGLQAALAIGNTEPSDLRKSIFDRMKTQGLSFPSIVSPDAIINSDVIVAEGSQILDGVIVNSGSRIGRGVIVNTGSSIDHDCQISDFTHVAPGVTLSGGVKIGKNCVIGIGSCIIQNVEIGDFILIGAGSVVTSHCREVGTYVGSPARRIK